MSLEFKRINGWGGRYWVTNNGYVYKGDRCMCSKPNKDGYTRVQFMFNKIRRGFLIHRLVLTYFDRPPVGREQAMHLDNDKTNNKITNLRWGSQSENMLHSYKTGTMKAPVGHRSKRAKLTEKEVDKLRSLYASGTFTMKALARTFGISYSTTNYIINRKTYAH